MSAANASGVKRRCLSCAGAFFDLGRTPIVCPKCGADFKVVELPRSRPPTNAWRFGASGNPPVVK
jgi:hypothetical protein